jgi:hypothetical protein
MHHALRPTKNPPFSHWKGHHTVADIAISYSHTDASPAYAAYRELEAIGYTVWIDDPADKERGTAAIGLPVGQDHWRVISTEFAAADLIIVIDTPGWHASKYCQDEYTFLRDWGKWVEFYVPDSGSVAELAAKLRDRHALTAAHARLVLSAQPGAVRSASLAERMLRRSEARDAEAISTVDAPWLVVTEKLAAVAKDVQERAVQARRRLWQGGITITITLAVLALVGSIALVFALNRRDDAVRAANVSRSLNSAAEVGAEADTGRALDLAETAVDFADTPAATEALNTARANDQRLRSVTIDRREYIGAAWAPGAPIIVGYARNAIQQFDGETGAQLGTIHTPADVKIGAIAVSRSGQQVAFTANGLWIADFATGSTRKILSAVDRVATGDGIDLWFATPRSDGSELGHTTFGDVGNAAKTMKFDIPAAPLAMSASAAKGILDYVDARGKLHTARYTDTTVAETSVVEIASEQDIEGTQAVVTRCGDNVFGSVPMRGIWDSSFELIGTALTTDRVPFALNPPLCNADHSAWATYTVSSESKTFARAPRPYLPWGADRYVTVRDTEGVRAAVVTPDGWLYLFPGERIEYRDVPGIQALVVFPHREYVIGDNGDVIDTTDGTVTGTIGDRKVRGPVAAVLGNTAAIATDEGVVRVNDMGRPSVIPIPGDAEISSVRAGADGRTFVIVHDRAMTLLDAEGSTRTIEPTWLESDRSLLDGDIASDGRAVVMTTTAGQIALAAVDSTAPPMFWEERLPVGTVTLASFVPATGHIVAVGRDGIIREFDRDLKTINTAFLGDVPGQLDISSGLAIVLSEKHGLTVYDLNGLVVKDRIAPTKIVAQSFVHIPGSGALVGLKPRVPRQDDEDERAPVRVRIPLPTCRAPA